MLIALFKMDFHSFSLFFSRLSDLFYYFSFLSFSPFSIPCIRFTWFSVRLQYGFPSFFHIFSFSHTSVATGSHQIQTPHIVERMTPTKKRAQRSWSFNAFLTFIRLICNREIIRYDIVFIISTVITATTFGYTHKTTYIYKWKRFNNELIIFFYAVFFSSSSFFSIQSPLSSWYRWRDVSFLASQRQCVTHEMDLKWEPYGCVISHTCETYICFHLYEEEKKKTSRKNVSTIFRAFRHFGSFVHI